jgi:hypothetical protein
VYIPRSHLGHPVTCRYPVSSGSFGCGSFLDSCLWWQWLVLFWNYSDDFFMITLDYWILMPRPKSNGGILRTHSKGTNHQHATSVLMLISSPGWAFFLPDFNSPPSVSPLSRENKANFLIVLNYQKLWTLWTQGLMLSRKVLCHLIHSSRTFFSVWYFWNRLSQTICLDWHWNEVLLISASWVGGGRPKSPSPGSQSTFYMTSRFI